MTVATFLRVSPGYVKGHSPPALVDTRLENIALALAVGPSSQVSQLRKSRQSFDQVVQTHLSETRYAHSRDIAPVLLEQDALCAQRCLHLVLRPSTTTMQESIGSSQSQSQLCRTC